MTLTVKNLYNAVMNTAFITVNFNGGQQLVDTLESLLSNTRLKRKRLQQDDVFIVDNGSEDDSLSKVRGKFPQINIVEAGKNLGFGKAHNLLFEQIFAGKYKQYDYFALVNPDLILTKNWFAPLYETIDSSNLIAAVNPMILYNERFRRVGFVTSNPEIYINTDDYRFLAPVVGDPEADTPTKELMLGDKSYIRPNQRDFYVLLEPDAEALHLNIYDESLRGYVIKIDGAARTGQSIISTFGRKFLYKIGLAGMEAKLEAYNVSLRSLHHESYPPVEIINSLGAHFRFENLLPENNYYGQVIADAPKDPFRVELFHGACAILNAKVVKKLGGFDDRYFMYYEESDLAMRMNQSGYRVKAVPESRVYHLERGTRSPKLMEFMEASQEKFISRWASKLKKRYESKRLRSLKEKEPAIER
jgi:GT2 family glycosyltransferase